MIGGFPQGGKNFIKRKDKRKTPRADNFVFRLHYQFTFGILVSVTVFSCDASLALFLVMERQENRNSVSVAFITTFPSQQKATVLDAMITISMTSFLSQWVAMMLVAGQNYIDSSGSAIQCMQDKGNGKN